MQIEAEMVCQNGGERFSLPLRMSMVAYVGRRWIVLFGCSVALLNQGVLLGQANGATGQSDLASDRSVQAKDHSIVLRDLSVLGEVSIVDFDRQGVSLDNGRRLAWKDILQAKVSGERQGEFDQLLKEVGLPRFRLEQRLLIGDWVGAERVISELGDLSEAARLERFQVAVARSRARLAVGDRLESLEPFLDSVRHFDAMDEAERAKVSKYGWPAESVRLQFSERLIPVWFDRKAAESVYKTLKKKFPLDKNSSLGLRVYHASLAIAVGAHDEADLLLAGAESMEGVRVGDSSASGGDKTRSLTRMWFELMRIEIMLERGDRTRGFERLKEEASSMAGSARAAAWLLEGLYFDLGSIESGEATAASTRASLSLFRVAALYRRYPSLSAAALFRAVEIAEATGRPDEAKILRDELLRTYPRTYHGRLLKGSH